MSWRHAPAGLCFLVLFLLTGLLFRFPLLEAELEHAGVRVERRFERVSTLEELLGMRGEAPGPIRPPRRAGGLELVLEVNPDDEDPRLFTLVIRNVARSPREFVPIRGVTKEVHRGVSWTREHTAGAEGELVIEQLSGPVPEFGGFDVGQVCCWGKQWPVQRLKPGEEHRVSVEAGRWLALQPGRYRAQAIYDTSPFTTARAIPRLISKPVDFVVRP